MQSAQDFRGVAYVDLLTAFDSNGSNPLIFKRKRSSERHIFLDDDIVGFLPDDPVHVMINWSPDNYKQPRLYKLNVYTSKLKLFQKGKRGVQVWLTDQKGKVRMGVGSDGGKFKAFHRPVNGGKWQLLFTRPLEERYIFDPILIDARDSDIAYVLSDFNADTVGLYKYRLASASFAEEIFRHPKLDVNDIILNRTGTEIQGVTFISSELEPHWLQPMEPELLDRIRGRLPGFKLSISSKSENYKRLVIHASASDRPVRYYLYEPEQDHLQFFAATYPQLDGEPLSSKRTMTYEAQDGLEIEAIVSLPVGVSFPPSAPLPTIIMPQEGPTTRDPARFDPMVQFLTSRGYAVLQINFRGSAGYGRKFKMAGKRQWGPAMQNDVFDGTQWLIEQGVADPGRICIVGETFGGHMALMGAIRAPDLYQCAISVNGVSDLKDMKQQVRHFNFRRVANRFVAGWDDGDMLDENSPAKRAKDIVIPILLAHSTKDAVVNFDQSKSMAKALEKAGKDYQFVVLENGDHNLSLGGVRPVLFTALEAFLKEHLR